MKYKWILVGLYLAAACLVASLLSEWADSLPPSPEELRGEIPMGPVAPQYQQTR